MPSPVERISAVTSRVVNMTQSVRFYTDVSGMELLYVGEGIWISSLRARNGAICDPQSGAGEAVPQWGRLMFYVTDVDAFWIHLRTGI